MDSGNSSGSMQSSSGGEEEYDSRAESSSSFSALFLNNHHHQQLQTHFIGPFSTTTTTTTTTSGGEPPNSSSSHNLNPLTHQHHSPMFDPLSSYYLDHPIQRPISSSTTTTTTTTTLIPNNHPISLDMMWSTKFPGRSEPNQPDLSALMQLGAQNRGHVGGVAAFPTTTQQHPLPPQQQAQNNSNNGVRNPKKRSRASRRAPTTVLTTDTTNFRAMVQEFTGIPAPPFTSSPFPRTRLDLFGSVNPSSSSSSAIRSNLEPPYLLRPFAQKVQPFSSSSSIPSSSTSISFPLLPNSSSSMVDTLLAPNSNNSSNSCANNSTSINYQQVHLNNNMHNNPIFSFNSILQAQQQKYPPPLLGSKTHQPSLEIPQTNSTTIDSSLKVGVFEELGLMSHAHVNNTTQVGGGGLHHHHHQNMVHSSSDGALSRINNNNDGGDHGGSGVILSPLGNLQERVSNGKMNNYMASDFHHGGEKGPDCGVAAAAAAVTTAARSEGMVESWINCSSD